MNEFLHDESGATTVDWVVLTAIVVGIALSSMVLLTESTTALMVGVSDAIIYHVGEALPQD